MFTKLIYYNYPQYLWAKEIKKIFKRDIIADHSKYNIYDAPCGNGVISYWLIKPLNNNFYLFDIDETRLNVARKNIQKAIINKQDIFSLKTTNNNDNIWLLINSLYCLPEKEKLLNNLSLQMDYIIAVFPYINHSNYKTFFALNKNYHNPSEMNKNDTIQFFNSYKYQLIYDKDLTFIPYYKFNIRIVYRFLLPFLNLLDKIVYNKKSAYWLAVFKKQ